MTTRPIVPEDIRPNGRPRPGKYLERACFAHARHAMAHHGEGSVESIAKAIWSYDDVTPTVLKAASSPAQTTGTWGSALATTAVSDFISSLAPISAAAKLLDASVRVSLAGINSISFPSRSGAIDPAATPWIPQGAPIPVGQLALTSVTLGPMHKLGLIATMTRETAEHSSGETVLTTLLRENAALALDSSLFSTAAATADRPAGLLAGISALPAAPNGDDAAMTSDLADLAAAIGDDTAGPIAYIAHPAQVAAIRLRRGTTLPSDIPIWPSLAVAAGTVIVVDPTAIISAVDSAPEITSSKEALLHMESASPLQIASGAQGSGVLASPARSLFQTDAVAVRCILRAAWVLRAPAVAWVSSVTW
jgi:Phage capsid family